STVASVVALSTWATDGIGANLPTILTVEIALKRTATSFARAVGPGAASTFHAVSLGNTSRAIAALGCFVDAGRGALVHNSACVHTAKSQVPTSGGSGIGAITLLSSVDRVIPTPLTIARLEPCSTSPVARGCPACVVVIATSDVDAIYRRVRLAGRATRIIPGSARTLHITTVQLSVCVFRTGGRRSLAVTFCAF